MITTLTIMELSKLVKDAAEASEKLYKEGQHVDNEFTRNDEAARIACESNGVDLAFREPIYYLIQYVWNDILTWADEHKMGEVGDKR